MRDIKQVHLSDFQANQLKNIFNWGGSFYACRNYRNKLKYYRSGSVRFDDTFGGTYEIQEEEYTEMARKHAWLVGRTDKRW